MLPEVLYSGRAKVGELYATPKKMKKLQSQPTLELTNPYHLSQTVNNRFRKCLIELIFAPSNGL